MKNRCSNPKNSMYHKYGAKNIVCCERWKLFENFYEDMGKSYKDGLTLDRIDCQGNYEPNNCRWADYSQQNFNRRNFNVGWIMSPKEVMKLSGYSQTSVYRKKRQGYTEETIIKEGINR
jgi:uncharacterized protein YgiB involved in biofilm formation